MRKIILVIMAALLVVSAQGGSGHAALSLGSTQAYNKAAISQGGEAEFRVFLFNVHQEDDIVLYAGVRSDGGLSVKIDPEYMSIPYYEPGSRVDLGDGFVPLSTPEGSVMARVMRVTVGAPLSADPGTHYIEAYVATERERGTLGTAQTRTFRFEVDVEEEETDSLQQQVDSAGNENNDPGNSDEESPGEPSQETGVIEAAGKGADSITGNVTEVPMFGPFVLVAVVLVLVALWRLKKI
jgi:hypothetical protein